ncbi:MAG: hypothetical protein D6731_23110 [Planctomycetota bacterium]|nr:MAG: hypothetical protein D6731_23110 [Planctomycetota bacterium]
MTRTVAPFAPLLLALCAGCVSGPSYAGGPTSEEPHAVVDPSTDITLWRVDGQDVASRVGETLVEPGLRRLKIRIEADIADDSPTPYEYRDITLYAEPGATYVIERKPGDMPPWEVDIRKLPSR